MDKNAIKKFAVWARCELIARVSQKAEQYGITEEHHGDAYAERIGEWLLSRTEQNQRKNLITRIEQEGYRQVMEEAAYTWFNRFIALRFMEVNAYLPTRIRVFTDEENAFKPQILAEAIHMEMDGLDMEKVYAFKEKNQTEELFKYLIITQCNALSNILPGMFQRIEDYTELLFPDNLLREGSVIEQMIALIPEEDWQDQVQIIGWLYQYYNTEPKDQVFANLKKNIKIGKNDIPAATQLFTPDWIVRYMVENSLGRLWVEGHPDEALKSSWKYYLEEAEQEPQVQERLKEIRKEYAGIKPEDIRCIDPCMGSGHILCYLFDVLVQIYEAYGYSTREAVQSIVENNLYGLDIDDRAAQLAYFAVMMKARQYDRRFFTRGVQPHVMAIQESNTLEAFEHLQGQLSLDNMCVETANQLIRTFRDAKEYGSILNVEIPGLDTADRLMEQLHAIDGDFELMAWIAEAEELLPVLAKQAAIMQQKYDVVVTNPPYMGGRNMNTRLLDMIVAQHPEGKADLYAAFILRTMQMTRSSGFTAMITQHSWMFLSSFESLRNWFVHQNLTNMCHLGAHAFEEISGEVVQTTTWVSRKTTVAGYKGAYVRLVGIDDPIIKETAFLNRSADIYVVRQTLFDDVPGRAFAYWLGNPDVFKQGSLLEIVANPRQGMKTLDNDYYIRYWYEVAQNNMMIGANNAVEAKESGKKWFPINHGGEFRKYYGNNYFVVNWQNDGKEMKDNAIRKYNCITRTITNIDYYFKQGITWSVICSQPSFRWYGHGFLFSNGGQCVVPNSSEQLKYIIGILNSKVTGYLLNILSPTLGFESGYLKKIPIIIAKDRVAQVEANTQSSIDLCRMDWDAFEYSWDYQTHPIIRNRSVLGDCTAVACTLAGIGIKPTNAMAPLEICYHLWEAECLERFNQLKANEEELNRVFINIYGLQDELTPEVADKDVTVRKANLGRDIRSLISYAVGCMFGRYSIYKPGLIFAGEPYSLQAFVDKIDDQPGVVSAQELNRAYRNEGIIINEMFEPDKDGILPITDDEYFSDDIVGRFVEFVKTVYGEDTLEENLKFVADALGGKGSPRQVIRDYFLNDFYADHLKTYQKRPIYWLFDSGKKNGFKCLIYMHRYAPDTIARIRTDYVHEQQSRYRTAIADLEKRVASASTAERVKLTKQLAGIQAQADELHIYEEKIHHYADQMIPIDLDDGVKVNYAKFADVLAKIK